MGESCENNFLDGDVVWVKLGALWWPGEVVGSEKLPPDILYSFKKPPYAVVRFFQEDTYEYVKNDANILKYNCSRKNEFIKKGMDKHRGNISSMEKFPGDVVKAEILTNGDPDILKQDQFTPTTTTKKERDRYSGLFGDAQKKTPNNKKGKGKVTISPKSFKRTPARTLKGNPDYKAHILIQGKNESTEQEPIPDKIISTPPPTLTQSHTPISTPGAGLYSCHACPFTTTRINVLVIHTKTHTGTYTPNTPSPKVTQKEKPPVTKKKEKPVKAVAFTKPDKLLKPQNDKKAQERRGRRRKRDENSEKVADKQEKRQKTDEEIKSTLLADWSEVEDSDSEAQSESEIKKDILKQNEIEMNTPSTSRLEFEINTEVVEEKPEPVEKEDVEKKDANMNSDKIDSNSCFDFREEEDWPIEKDIGRRIPRVKSNSESKGKNDVDLAREVAEFLEQTTVPVLPTPPPLPSVKSAEKSFEKTENFPQREAEGAPPPRAIFKTKTFFRSRHSRSQDVIEKYIADQLKADKPDTNGMETSNIDEIETPTCDVKVAKLAPKIQLKKMKAEAQMREAKEKKLARTSDLQSSDNEPENSNITALPKDVIVAEEETSLNTIYQEFPPLKEQENTLIISSTNTKNSVLIETKSPSKIQTKSPRKNETVFKKKKLSPFKIMGKSIHQLDKPQKEIQLTEKIECLKESKTDSQVKIRSPEKTLLELALQEEPIVHVGTEAKPILKTSEKNENDADKFEIHDEKCTNLLKMDDIEHPEVTRKMGEKGETTLLQIDNNEHSDIKQNSVDTNHVVLCTASLQEDGNKPSENTQNSIVTGHGEACTTLLQDDVNKLSETTENSFFTGHGETCTTLLQDDVNKLSETTENSFVTGHGETCTTLLQDNVNKFSETTENTFITDHGETYTTLLQEDVNKLSETTQKSFVAGHSETGTTLLQEDVNKLSETTQNSLVTSCGETCTTLLPENVNKLSETQQNITGHGDTCITLLQAEDDNKNPEIMGNSKVTSHGESCTTLLQMDDCENTEITKTSIVTSHREICTTFLQIDDTKNTEITRKSFDTKDRFDSCEEITDKKVHRSQILNELDAFESNMTPSAVDALLSISKANVMHSKISEDPPDDIFADDSKAIEHSVLTFSNEDNSDLNETITVKDDQKNRKHLCPSESDLQIAETLLNLPTTVKSKEILQRKNDDVEIIIEGGKIVTRFEITPSVGTQKSTPSYESEIEKNKNLNAAESLVQMSKSMNFVSKSNSSNNSASVKTQPTPIEDPKSLESTPQKSAQTSSKLLKILEEPLNAKKSQYTLFTKEPDKILNFDVSKKQNTQVGNFLTTPQRQKIIIRRATSTTKSFVESKSKQEQIIIPRSNTTPVIEAKNLSTYALETKKEVKIDPSPIIIQPMGKKQANSVQQVLPQTTIITSTGALVQKMNSNDIFDINSMPIVLSDEILTPESIENMPVVLSDGSIVTEMPHKSPNTTNLKRPSNTSVEKAEPPAKKPSPKIIIKSETRLPPNHTLIAKHANTPNILSRTQKFKSGQSTFTSDNSGGRKIIITKADVRKKPELLPNQSAVNTKTPKPTISTLINQKPTIFKPNSQKSFVANPVSPKQPVPKQESPKPISLSPTISKPKSPKPQLSQPSNTTGVVRNEKFIILPAATANRTQKILMSPSAGKTQLLMPKPAASIQDRPSETGKIMIITNAQGGKSRLILTPEHEKLLFPQKNTVTQPTAVSFSSFTPIVRTTSQSVLSKMKPVFSVSKSVTSVSKPLTSVHKPAVSVSKPAAPASKPAVSVSKPAAVVSKPPVSTYKPAAVVSKPPVSTYKPATSSSKSIVQTSKPVPLASQQTTISKPAPAQSYGRSSRIAVESPSKPQKSPRKVPQKEQIIILQQKSGPNIQLTQAQFEYLQKTGQIVQKTSKNPVETKSTIKKSVVGKHSLLPVNSAATSTPVLQQNIITQTIPTENRQIVQNLLIQAPATMLIQNSSNVIEQVVETTPLSNTKLESIPPLPQIIESPKQQTSVGSADLDNLEDILPATAIARHQESNEATFSQLMQQEAPSINTNQLNANAQANLGDNQLLAVPGENFGGPPDSFFLCVEENGTLTPIDERPLILENNQLVPMTVPWPEPAPVQAPPRDILAAALANTDVFPGGMDPPDFRDLNANVAVHCHVSETSTTLNNPIMSTLEVPTSLADGPPPAADLDTVLGVTNPSVPTSLNLPITVTDPRIASAPISMPILDDGLPHSMPILTDVIESNSLTVETHEECERMQTETLIITPGSISSEEIPYQPTITVSNEELDVSTEITS